MSPDEAVAYAQEWVENKVAAERRLRESQIAGQAARELCVSRHDLGYGQRPCKACRRDVDQALEGQQEFDSVEEDRREFERRMP